MIKSIKQLFFLLCFLLINTPLYSVRAQSLPEATELGDILGKMFCESEASTMDFDVEQFPDEFKTYDLATLEMLDEKLSSPNKKDPYTRSVFRQMFIYIINNEECFDTFMDQM